MVKCGGRAVAVSSSWSELHPVTEMFLQLLLAVGEDLLDIPLYEEVVNERAAGWAIADFIHAPRAAVVIKKTMGVMPQLIRAAQLLIHKVVRRIPFRDLRLPAERKTVYPQLVVNQRARTHFNWSRGENNEVQPRWRDSLQISRVGEKIEDDLPWLGQPEFALEQIRFHRRVAPGLDLNWFVANMAV
jgi:hypothetical protein